MFWLGVLAGIAIGVALTLVYLYVASEGDPTP